VPLNDTAIAAFKVVFEGGNGKGRVFKSRKTGNPLENGRHWFDDAVMEAGIENFLWHGLAAHVCKPIANAGHCT
jgi:hypothetical protein